MLHTSAVCSRASAWNGQFASTTRSPWMRGSSPCASSTAATSSAAFLSALGVATDTAATTDTPARMARAYAEMLSPRSFDLTTFANDEHYPDTPYVVDLVTCGVVNTMPEATLHAVADHGVLRGDTVIAGYHHAVEVMTALAEIGVDYDDVVDTLERDGLTTFQASWAALTETVERDRDAPLLA